LTVVYRALLVCSDEGCAAEYEVFGTLPEIEALCCDCGLGLQSLGWPEEAAESPYEAEDTPVRLILLPLGSSPE
jgi:hypothetical protein